MEENGEFLTPKQGALLALKNGLKVFPLVKNTKIPPKGLHWQKWARDSKIETVELLDDDYNFAIDCEASGITVVDVDPRSGGFETIIEKGIFFPETLTVETPSGGVHYYYKGVIRGGTHKLGDGVDVKSYGGYVVCFGSSISGISYHITNKKFDLHTVPDDIKRLAELTSNDRKIYNSDSDLIIKSGERNIELTSLAGLLRSRGLGRETILSMLTAANNNHVLDPLPEDEINVIANSVVKYSPTTVLPAIAFDSPDRKEESGLCFPSMLIKTPTVKREWVVEGWIPQREISSLYGSGGMGKSLVSLQLAVSVAHGVPFFGKTVKQMPTLCVFCEDTVAEIHRRYESISKATEYLDIDHSDRLLLWSRVGKYNDLVRNDKRTGFLTKGLFNDELETQLKSMPAGHKLLILDNISDIYLADENVREKVNVFVKTVLTQLVDVYDLSVLLLGHPSRAGQSTGDMMSGSTAWENAVRNRITLSKHGTLDGINVLKKAKSNYSKTGEEIHIEYADGRFRLFDQNNISVENIPKKLKTLFDSMGSQLQLGKNIIKEVARKLSVHNPELGTPKTVERNLLKLLEVRVQHDGFLYELAESRDASDKGALIIRKIKET